MGGKDSRGKILDTARAHFLEHSYSGATLREISSGANVTTGSLYHHFSGKDELFVEVCVQGLRKMLMRFQTAQRLTEGRPIVERFTALFDAYMAFYIEERGFWELIQQMESAPDQLSVGPELAKRVEEVSRQIMTEMVELLRSAEPGLGGEETRKRVLFATAIANGMIDCERRGLLSRFGFDLGAFRGIIIMLGQHLFQGIEEDQGPVP